MEVSIIKRQGRQACFVCTTPYQVIGAINITTTLKLEADLYIFGTFSKYDKIAEKLSEENIFVKVIPVARSLFDLTGKHYFKLAKAFFQMVTPGKVVSSFLDAGLYYDAFYSTSLAHIKTILHQELLRRNPQMSYIIYDDGLGSYSSSSHVLNATVKKRSIQKLLGWKQPNIKKTSLMLYNPGMAKLPEELKQCSINQMPQIDFCSVGINALKTAYEITQNDFIRQKVIIFDTVRGVYRQQNDIFSRLDECYSLVLNLFGKENVICKNHPRSRKRPNVDAQFYDKSSIPMEIIYSEMENLSDRLLLSYNSTVVYTPKLFLDKEPIVISLHRIISETVEKGHEAEDLYQKFKAIYKDRSRVYAPETLEVLKTCLLEIIEKEESKKDGK